jgi:hypothetical protein
MLGRPHPGGRAALFFLGGCPLFAALRRPVLGGLLGAAEAVVTAGASTGRPYVTDTGNERVEVFTL